MIIALFVIFASSIFPCTTLVLCQTLPPYPGVRDGEWELLRGSVGISAMHMQLLYNNKVIIFDRTDFGPSNLSLPGGRCRYDASDNALKVDCTAHSILYDISTNTFRALNVQTDTWCSSGAVLPDGSLIQTGGYNDGDRVIRSFTPCTDDQNSCDWIEFPNHLTERRWYATNQILPDGRIIIVGGRRQFNYEFYNSAPGSTFRLNFLLETMDSSENNLYPFLHLLPDGNLFIFANTRSVLFNYNQNRVVKEFPRIPGDDPRNYPSSGSSVLLPLDENVNDNVNAAAEIMVCGGAPRDGFLQVTQYGNFTRALSTCGRLNVSDENPNWVVEEMPIARVMGDMLVLPNGDVIIINGAGRGTAGWECGRDPVRTPVIYRPSEASDQRFSVMSASPKPRLYHSSAVLLPDGRILVGGSNPHIYYNFTGVEFPTDLSLEAFTPPYLAAGYSLVRPVIMSLKEVIRHREFFTVTFTVPEYLTVKVLSVRIIAPSFTTHAFSMNQRMVVLKLIAVSRLTKCTYNATVAGPSTAEIAPPGYYMLFVVHAGIPSSAGSNPHLYYNFTGYDFPTDLSLEAFSPAYLAASYTLFRPKIMSLNEVMRYREFFTVTFTVPEYLTMTLLSVRIIAPSFTTHAFSMNQRMVVLKLIEVSQLTNCTYNATVVGPSTAEIAPPGFYMLFVVHASIPSSAGMWVKVRDWVW